MAPTRPRPTDSSRQTRPLSKALVSAHLALVAQMQKRGREAAEALDTAYPETLERAVLAYVHGELERMGAPAGV